MDYPLGLRIVALLLADSGASFGFGDLLAGDFCCDGFFEAGVVEEPGG